MSYATLGALRRPKHGPFSKPALYVPLMQAAVQALGGKFTMPALVAKLREQAPDKVTLEKWIREGNIGNQITVWRDLDEIRLVAPSGAAPQREFEITEKWRGA